MHDPGGVLDSLCAVDSVAIAVAAVALLLARGRPAPARMSALLVHLPILLAVASLSALLGGHTHARAAGGHAAGSPAGANPPSFYCRLL